MNTVIFDEAFILGLFIFAAIATAMNHPFVGLAIGLVAFGLFVGCYIMERRDG